MTPEQVASLHACAFEGQSRGWDAAEFRALLASPHVFCVGDTRAFALGRVVADEAELLTIAVRPQAQGKGLGKEVLHLFEAEAKHRGAARYFLEVAADNARAIRLYHGAGYQEVARRAAYYARTKGAPVDALVFERAAQN